MGLSPRVRGNRFLLASDPATVGPIPACAGQPFNADDLDGFFWAYPRVCGATWLKALWVTVSAGLSPRVRGNQVCSWRNPRASGPIPACAGQPNQSPGAVLLRGAYPRVCGATGGEQLLLAVHQGLSPRVRGNRTSESVAGSIDGPIPACAGQPRRTPWPPRLWGAYPRVCGATGGQWACNHFGLGLSPRVRGNRQVRRERAVFSGPIPACAGQP